MAEAPSERAAPASVDAAVRRRFKRRYEILEEVSQGGMGVVYRARDTALGRDVALKVLQGGPEASEENILRFRREASSIAALRHPNIVPVHDVGEEEGTHYFTMDFVEGESLPARIEKAEIEPRRALEITAQVARAIHHAHERGVIHRDIKPHNILVTPEGTPKIMDFGLARPIASDTKITQTGMTMGTPPYMSPEQARGLWDEVDARSDVYALGATLFELLCGKPPFEGPSGFEILLDVVEEDPPRPRTLNPALDSPTETIVLKAMDKDPARRYASALEMAEDIERHLRGLKIVARPLRGRIRRSWRKTKRLIVGNLVLFLALFVAGAGLVTVVSAKKYHRDRNRQDMQSPLLPVSGDPDDPGGETQASAVDFQAVEGRLEDVGGEDGGGVRLAPVRDGGWCVALSATELECRETGLQIGFDAYVPTTHRGPRPEVGCFLYAAAEDFWDTGYRFSLGQGFGNRCALFKNGKPVRTTDGFSISAGRTLILGQPRYRLSMGLNKGRVALAVNGETVLSFRDDHPWEVARPTRCFWGVYVRGAALVVKGFDVRRRGVPRLYDTLALPDEFYLDRSFEKALRRYRLVVESYREQEPARFARYRMNLCRHEMERAGTLPRDEPSAVEGLESLIADAPGSDGAFLGSLFLAGLRADAGEFEKALALIDGVLGGHPEEERVNRVSLFCLDRAGKILGKAEGGAGGEAAETAVSAFLRRAEKGGEYDAALGARACLALGEFLAGRGRSGEAVEAWKRGASAYGDAPLDAARCGFREAVFRRSRGDAEEALASLSRLVEVLDASSLLKALALMEMGQTLRMRGEGADAVEVFEQVGALAREEGLPADLQGWAALFGMLAETERGLSGSTGGGDVRAWRDRWARFGRVHGAVRGGVATALMEALVSGSDVGFLRSPRRAPPRGPLADMLARLAAHASRKPASGKTSDRPGPFAFLASFMAREGEDPPVSAFLASLEGESTPPELLYEAGLRYERFGREAEAESYFRRCIESADGTLASALAKRRMSRLREGK